MRLRSLDSKAFNGYPVFLLWSRQIMHAPTGAALCCARFLAGYESQKDPLCCDKNMFDHL